MLGPSEGFVETKLVFAHPDSSFTTTSLRICSSGDEKSLKKT